MPRVCAQAQGDKFKAVSTDLWTQLLDFCETVEPDLTGWSEDDACASPSCSFSLPFAPALTQVPVRAGPSAIDAFVEWKREKDGGAS